MQLLRPSMNPGIRKLKSASLRVARPVGLPHEMQEQIRELIDMHSANQRKGHATALLKAVCKEADTEWLTLMVQVQPFDDGMDMDKLKRWYERLGFVEVQSQPVILMARSPR